MKSIWLLDIKLDFMKNVWKKKLVHFCHNISQNVGNFQNVYYEFKSILRNYYKQILYTTGNKKHVSCNTIIKASNISDAKYSI